MDKIIEYYLLCTLRNGDKRHIISDIPKTKMPIFFNKQEIIDYFKPYNSGVIIKETVVGGKDNYKIIVV